MSTPPAVTTTGTNSGTSSTSAVGWTPARGRRSWVFITVLAIAGVAALWAMMLPWAGLKLGTAPATCVIGERSSAVSTYNAEREVVPVTASGCVSAYQSIHPEQMATPTPNAAATATTAGTAPSASLATAQEGQDGPFGAPPMKTRMGLPSMTFWLVAAAVLGALALASRHTLLMLPCIVMLNSSNHAFTAHRAALTWGLDGMVAEMRGVQIHQYAFAAVVITLLAGFVFLAKVNAEQRKADTAAYEAGERDTPPRLLAAQLVGTYLLRGIPEKLADVADAAKKDAAARKAA